MNKFRLLLVVAFLSISMPALAEKVAVIASAENHQNLTADDVENISLDCITTWGNGGRIKAYDLPVKDSVRQVFSSKSLGMRIENFARA